MSGRKLGPFLAVITFLPIIILGSVSKETDSMLLYYIGTVMFILWAVACVQLKDFFQTLWIGPIYETMDKELQDLQCFLQYPASKRTKELDPQIKRKLEKKVRKLEEKMREYRKLQQ